MLIPSEGSHVAPAPIKLNDGDYVKNVRIIPDTIKYFISISGNGLFKKTPAAEFNVQSRNTKGSKIQKAF